MWWLFFFVRTVLIESDNTNLNFIPKNAEIVVSVNGELLLEEALVTVVFQRHDPEIFELLENYTKRSTGQKYKLFGINYLSQVILFSMPVEERTIVGALFNLNNQEAFETNFRPLLSENQVLHATNNVGLIMTHVSQTNEIPLSKSNFNILAKDLLDNPTDNNIDAFFKDSEAILKTWMNGNATLINDEIESVTINTNINGRSIDISGTMECTQPSEFIGNEMITLDPSGLHFSSQLIPGTLNGFFRSFLGDSIPELNGISVNYYATRVIKDSLNPFLPNADVLLHFKNKISLSEILKSSSKIEYLEQNRFQYKGSELYFDQFNDSTVYIGKSDFKKLSFTTVSDLTLLSGDLNKITNIKGDGFLFQVIRMTRIFNSCEDFLNSVAVCHININAPVENRSKIEGSIQFKDDSSALNALLKLGIRGQFFD